METKGFPGGSMIKNPPANTVDMGSISSPGGSHMREATKSIHRNYWARALESRSYNYCSPSALQPLLCNKRSQHSEKPVHHNQRSAPAFHN